MGRLGAAACAMQVAARAGPLRAAMTDHAEVRAHVFELLGNILAERLKCVTTFWAVLHGGRMNALVTFEMAGHRLSHR
ncbi:hypothetical protein OKW35_005235 [Paraburkholderia sp. MM5477-R1]